MTSTPDPRLLEAHDLARAALKEITPEATIGDPAGHLVEDDGVLSLLFENRLHGYPGWYWTVTIARVGDEEPTVLEAELLPREGALLAPEWVPWAERLADYHALQAAAGVLAEAEDEVDDEFADVDDLDAADFDADGSPILHAGDVDGVDIDVLDESDEEDELGDADLVEDEFDESDDDDDDDADDDAADDDDDPDAVDADADGDDDDADLGDADDGEEGLRDY
ncbi:DUF3027 domain-containing protein [Micromonospora sp. DT81.3]|uniref:DUF3027 domain-containing protein n=1 Tax=Micromonospora sp. DT81.3 TaxID=3416523 RepID=UPI003CF709A1